jgi:hypothetical protein
VDLEEELEQLAVGELGRVEHHLDRLGVRAVIAVSGVRHVAAAVAHSGALDARQLADQVLHAPEASAREDRRLGVRHGDISCLAAGADSMAAPARRFKP